MGYYSGWGSYTAVLSPPAQPLNTVPELHRLMQALFKVFDRSNRGTVTEAQFFSLLDQASTFFIPNSRFLIHHHVFFFTFVAVTPAYRRTKCL